MADNTTIYTLTSEWNATNRYTAGSETDVLLSNVGRGWLRWATTTTTTAPTILENTGHKVSGNNPRAMTLAAGTYLWLVGEGKAALEV